MVKRDVLGKPSAKPAAVADDEEEDAVDLAVLDIASSEEEDDEGEADDEADEADAAAPEGLEDSEEESEDSADGDLLDALVEYRAAAAANAAADTTPSAEPGPGRRRGGGGDEQARPLLQPGEADADAAEAGPSGRDHLGDQDQDDLPSDRPADPGSDSSEDERPNRNTVGDVPMWWYKNEDHIGYDLEGKKVIRRTKMDRLDQLLDRQDNKAASRTIYDEYNDEDVVLSKEELAMVMRIRKGQFPSLDVNPFEPYNDYFTRDVEISGLSEAPEPKRRFIPSKWEEQKIVKLVRAMRKGWLKTNEQQAEARKARAGVSCYLLWADDNQTGAEKTPTGLSYIPPQKAKLPGHAESYNPPKEYLPTQEERDANEVADPEDKQLLATGYTCLRHVPAYENFIKERFERCLDLYLCPRVRRKRLFIDPETLVPKLPSPRDLRPFPTTLAMRFTGHVGQVRSVAPDPSGQWVASGGDDGTLRLWEVRSGRCARTWQLGAPVHSVAWCPNSALRLISAASGTLLVLLPSGVGTPEVEAAVQALVDSAPATSGADAPVVDGVKGALCKWVQRVGGGIELQHSFPIRQVSWHARGDYFSTVAPTGNTQSVLVHQLSKMASQNPFRKNRGRVVRVAFHPAKPFFFVATQNNVRVYNLAQQALAKKLICGSGVITSLAVHSSGDHVLVGSEDKRLAWFDLDLSTKPYKALRYHSAALRGVAFHARYPLFASGADDGAVHVFHGAVFADLLSNPLIVPVKILRPAQEEGARGPAGRTGVLDVAFHPTQPWLFSAGEDGDVCMFCN